MGAINDKLEYYNINTTEFSCGVELSILIGGKTQRINFYKRDKGVIENLINNKDKIIFHCTCTGFGGTIIEPNVPEVEWIHKQVQKLIAEGFPTQQITLRVDPIISTLKGLQNVQKVLDMFKDTGVKRVRYSFLDMYSHVKERFNKAGIPLPYNSFMAPKYMINNTLRLLIHMRVFMSLRAVQKILNIK
jgi:hypothetical protein